MNSLDLRPLRALAALTLCALVAVGATAAKKEKKKDADEGESVTIQSWLVAGPQAHPLPVLRIRKRAV